VLMKRWKRRDEEVQNVSSVTERRISLRFHPILTHLIFDTSSSLLCVFTRSTWLDSFACHCPSQYSICCRVFTR
jgi:hypothetical protein